MMLEEPIIVVARSFEIGKKWAANNIRGADRNTVVVEDISRLAGARRRVIILVAPLEIAAVQILSLEFRNVLIRIPA